MSRVSKIFLSVKVVPHIQGVPGSHWGLPGGLGGAPSGRSSVTVAMDGSDAVSQRGIRVENSKKREKTQRTCISLWLVCVPVLGVKLFL